MQSATLRLKDEIDISRGDMIVHSNRMPEIGNSFNMDICWFHEKPLDASKKYILRQTTNELKCMIKGVNFITNIETYAEETEDLTVKMNGIANISIATAKPMFYDSYRKNRVTGSVVLIDEGTNETVAAGMIN